jgi:hypothetical protein
MIPTRTEKKFDCVEFKRQAQREIYEQIKDLSPEEQIRYYRERAAAGALGEWWRTIRDGSQRGADGVQSRPAE